jgi:selenide,water dikinase
MKRLVLLGGGHAHLFVLENLAANPDDKIDVSLVTPLPTLLYTGMLPGYVAGHYSLERCSIDLMRLAGQAHASFVQTNGVLINPDAREVICADGTVIGYDVLSIDIGSQPVIAAKGVERNALVLRPLAKFVNGWMRLLAHTKNQGLGSVSVVGGGAGGVEVAFAIAHRFRRELDTHAPHVRIITDTPKLLPEFPDAVRERVLANIPRYEMGVHAGSAVAEVGSGFIRLDNHLEFESGATLWAVGAGAPEIFRDSGLATDSRGFLAIDDNLQSTSHKGIFAAGDCATHLRNPRPKAGVFAVRAGPVLAANLRSALAGGALTAFRPRRHYMALISAGRKHAIGAYGPFAWEGNWAWNWKDRIDRRFVDRFTAT